MTPVPGAASPWPEVVAHRGSSQDEPEHTLSAYRRAIADGADALECDVRLTADGHLVCVHDRRVNRTSNGRGVVSTLELATLEGLDWGSWKQRHGDEQELPDRDRAKLLTLRQLLAMVLDCGREVGVLIETKHPTRYAGLVERRLALTLASMGLDGRHCDGRPFVRVMSFSQAANARMAQLCPGVPRVLLMERTVPKRYRGGSLPRGTHIVGLDKELLRRWPETVRRQHDQGHLVYAFTVDEDDDLDRCLETGVDAIITNRPVFVRDRVRSRRLTC